MSNVISIQLGQCGAADALLAIRPKGPIKVFSIDPDKKGSPPIGTTFRMPNDRGELQNWIDHRNGDLKHNVYFEPGIPLRASNRK